MAKTSKPKRSDQLSSISPELIKEFSEFNPSQAKQKPYVQEEFVQDLLAPLKSPKLPEYLQGIYTSTGQNLYTLTMNIIRRIQGGLMFSEAVESFGENIQEIKEFAYAHQGMLACINWIQARQMEEWIGKIRKAADRDWKAAAFYLERRYTYNFSELKGVPRDDSMPIKKPGRSASKTNKTLTEMTDEELVAELERSK